MGAPCSGAAAAAGVAGGDCVVDRVAGGERRLIVKNSFVKVLDVILIREGVRVKRNSESLTPFFEIKKLVRYLLLWKTLLKK